MSWFDAVAGAVDTAMVRRGRLRGGSDPRIARMPLAERLDRLERLATRYQGMEMMAFPGPFLAPGPPVRPTRRRAWGAEELGWPSGCARFDPEVSWPTDPANDLASATVLRCGRAGAPAVIVLHGYGGGGRTLERALWPLRALRRAGIDVVLATLPLHGPRSTVRTFTPAFPAQDPRLTHEGFRQAVHEITGLIAWLRAEGAPRVGLMGMSLGGYTTALIATLPGIDLSFAGLVIPLSSLSDFALRHFRLGHGPDALALEAALARVYRPSSPLARPPAIAPERVAILAARGDRITGVEQALRLGAHFGVAPVLGPGSHLIQAALPWRPLVNRLVDCLV